MTTQKLLLALGLCLFGLCLFVSTATAQVVPLERFPAEPEAFLEKVQTLGGKLVAEAEETLNKEGLSLEEQILAVDKMFWGLRFKYGDDWNVFHENLLLFCDFLIDKQFLNPGNPDPQSALPGHLNRMAKLLAVDGKLSQEDFEKICDAAVLIRDKYLSTVADHYAAFSKSALEYSVIYFIADAFDPDATRGFVQRAAEKLELDPDKPNNPQRSFDDTTLGTIRRTRLLGTELEMSGVDQEGNAIDIKQFRGKPVLLVTSQGMLSEANQSLSNKLYALLQGEGLVTLKVQQNTTPAPGPMLGVGMGATPMKERPISAEEVAAFPGTVVASPFLDFYRCYSPRVLLTQPYRHPGEAFCLFLIDAQGKVVRLQNNGYDAALWNDLKKMFPAKEAELSALLPEIQANQDYWTNEINKRCVVFQGKNLDPVKKRLLSLFEITDPGHNDHLFWVQDFYKDVRSPDSEWYQWYYSGLIYPAFQGFPDFPDVSPELRFRILHTTIKARYAEYTFRCLDDPSLQPEVVCKSLLDEIKQWKEDFPSHPFHDYFYSIRLRTISWLMMERIRKLPDVEKRDYAETILRELFALAEEVIPTGTPYHVGSDFRIILPEIIGRFRGIEFESVDDALIERFKRQFLMLILATSQDEQLIDFAVKELR